MNLPLSKSDFFKSFAIKHNLSEQQSSLLKEYAELIIEWNEKFNLTAKTKIESLFRDLFSDSMKIFEVYDLKNITSIADVGTGAGIPGIILKIINPSLKIILIEVSSKKRLFLEYVIKKLSLENVDIVALDWRTFNRKTSLDIDLFVTKAAFSDTEIIRMFREDCNYTTKALIYWASSQWIADKKSQPYINAKYPYTCNGKKFQLIEFTKIKKHID